MLHIYVIKASKIVQPETVMVSRLCTRQQFSEKRQVHELKKNGAKINVTDTNKNEYIELLTKYRMLDATKSQTEQLLIGFYK